MLNKDFNTFCEALTEAIFTYIKLPSNVKKKGDGYTLVIYVRPAYSSIIKRYDVKTLYDRFDIARTESKENGYKEIEEIVKEIKKDIDETPFEYETEPKIDLNDIFLMTSEAEEYMPYVTIPIPCVDKYVLVPFDGEARAISKAYLKKCHLTEKDLLKHARRNAKEEDVSIRFIEDGTVFGDGLFNPESIDDFSQCEMILVTDGYNPGGAVVLFDLQTLDYLSERMKDDLRITFVGMGSAFVMKKSAYKNNDAMNIINAFKMMRGFNFLDKCYIYERSKNELRLEE